MNTCIIFGAVAFDHLAEPICPGDYIIAADGGLRHTKKLNIIPNEILGDFDSLGYVPEGAVVHPVEKDDTDTMLAIRRGLELGYRRFVLYGGLEGRRLDHTVANFQSLCFLAQHDAIGFLVGREWICCGLKDGTLRFPAGAEGDFSVFCLGRDAHGVTLRGLYYEAEDITLTSDFPLGVSNHFTGKEATVTVRDGTLLLLWHRINGFPE